MTVPWELQLLGRLRAVHGERVVERFTTRKTGALLAWLALHPDRPQPREQLVERFWPDSAPAAGRNSLSQALSALRRELERSVGVTVFEADRDQVELLSVAVRTDVAGFRAALRRAEGVDAGSTEHVAALSEAVALYRGELLPAHYDDWILSTRDALAGGHQWALSAAVDAQLSAGNAAAAVRLAREAVAADDLREAARRDLIRALWAADQHAAARTEAAALVRMLEEALGVEPEEDTMRLVELVSGPNDPATARGGAMPVAEGTVSAEAAETPGPWEGTATWLVVRCAEEASSEERAGFLRRLGRLARDFGGHVVRPGSQETVLRLSRASDAVSLAVELRRGARIGLHMGLDTGEARATSLADASEDLLGRAAGPAAVCAAALAALTQQGHIVMTRATMLVASPHLSEESDAVPLGRYEVDDGRTSVALFEVAPTGGPPLSATPTAASAIPERLNRFVGRGTERAEVAALLVREDVRLLTIGGMGGIGKTRLANTVASDWEAAGSGRAIWVELAAVDNPAAMPRAIGEAAGLSPDQLADPLPALAEVLADAPTLMVLDNLEQLLPEGATWVAELLLACPATCLVTSRRRLGIEGERLYPLSPLPLPNLAELGLQLRRNPSVALFVDRVEAVQPDRSFGDVELVDVARLCAELEGVPLAIELAAARAGLLGPTQMLDRISDRLLWLAQQRWDLSERQRSLRGAIDWSYTLLDETQRRVFVDLAVFHGGWDLDAAEAVLDDPLILDRLAELRDASLISTEVADGVVRHRMLETLRAYVVERLAEDPERRRTLIARHASYFAEMADGAKHAIMGVEQAHWMTLLGREEENLRAALRWSGTPDGDTEIGLLLGVGLQYFWVTRGALRIGLEHLQPLLAKPDAGADPALQAQALRVAGGFASLLGDHAEAEQMLEAALALQRLRGDRWGELITCYSLALLAQSTGRLDRMRRLAETCVDGFRTIHTPQAERALAATLNLLGVVDRKEGRLELAADRYAESLDVLRRQGDRKAVATLLNNLAQVERDAGRLEAAYAHLREAMALAEAVGSRWSTILSMHEMASVNARAGDHERAARLMAAVQTHGSGIEQADHEALRDEQTQAIDALRALMGSRVFDRAWQHGAALDWAGALLEAESPLGAVRDR